MFIGIDIKETHLHNLYPEAFKTLLRDHSRFLQFKKKNAGSMTEEELSMHVDDPCNLIIWGTEDYIELGEEYAFHQPITVEKVTNEHGMIIRPRCEKTDEEQSQRVKDKAEVFTPSWICNTQNNLIDEAWFGKKGVFNDEFIAEDGSHRWNSSSTKIEFPEDKTWKDYVRDNRLEITCGEAPYLCSRYDTTTGEAIELHDRVGLLDRKLRVVSENCNDSKSWLKMAQDAYKSIYGYEWQGDNLLLARESLLCTFLEYYHAKFGKLPIKRSVNYIAYIISWNIWQMDGLKMVIPDSCNDVYEQQIFGEVKVNCPSCEKGDIRNHIGISCYVRNWNKRKGEQDVEFSSLL